MAVASASSSGINDNDERQDRDEYFATSRFWTQLRKFSGDDSTYEWSDFKVKLDSMLDESLKDRDKVKIFINSLKGTAELYLNSRPHLIHLPFSNLLAEFEKKFKIPPEVARARLAGVKQASNEKTLTFAARLKVLTNPLRPPFPLKLTPVVDNDGKIVLENGKPRLQDNPNFAVDSARYEGEVKAINSMLITHFLSGIRSELHDGLISLSFANYEEAVDTVMAFETKLASRNPVALMNAAVPNPVPSISQNLKKVNGQGQVQRNNFQKSQASSRHGTDGEVKRCYNCKKPGHYARDCYWRNSEGGSRIFAAALAALGQGNSVTFNPVSSKQKDANSPKSNSSSKKPNPKGKNEKPPSHHSSRDSSRNSSRASSRSSSAEKRVSFKPNKNSKNGY